MGEGMMLEEEVLPLRLRIRLFVLGPGIERGCASWTLSSIFARSPGVGFSILHFAR
jgi:hypothetical protein